MKTEWAGWIWQKAVAGSPSLAMRSKSMLFTVVTFQNDAIVKMMQKVSYNALN